MGQFQNAAGEKNFQAFLVFFKFLIALSSSAVFFRSLARVNRSPV
jgi:hypothetical protein